MLDQLANDFLVTQSHQSAISFLRECKSNGNHDIGVIIGKSMEQLFPFSMHIKREYGINCFLSRKYTKAFDIFGRLLNMKGLSEKESQDAFFDQHFCIDHVEDRYIDYNEKLVESIVNREKRPFPQVTVTMTSCKRFDLFEKTVNSFINCLSDIDNVDEWFCVDDNSSEEDRAKMKKLYPFFTFYFKTPDEKGHPRSMNIIRKHVKTPFMFHMEDDWKFFCKKPYITECMDVIGQDPRIAQCLINKNYTEIESDINVKGGDYNVTKAGRRFYIHEFVQTEEQKTAWTEKHAATPGTRHSNYWPHFSFRPSLIQTKILNEIGEFDETVSHFEMNYSYRYFNKGYISAFLEGIYCIHIGRLTSERHDKTKLNAYDLNGEYQLSGKEEASRPVKDEEKVSVSLDDFDIKIKTLVLNMDKREDRWKEFEGRANESIKFLNYERYSAIDGSKLVSTPQLQRIFDGNDYNMRMGMVGCAMSHIKMCIELINSEYDAYLILEDDVEFTPDFGAKFLHVYKQLSIMSWDMMYLGHHLYERFITDDSYDKEKKPSIEKWDRYMSLERSMGGTGGYIISKEGAQKLLDFINKTGMTNGIDTVQQKSADELDVFYAIPHLIYSECYRGDRSLDSDISFDYSSLTVPVPKRLEEEKEFWSSHDGLQEELGFLETVGKALEYVKDSSQTEPCYFEDDDTINISKLAKECVHPYYLLENTVIIIVPGGHKGRYFERLCKDGMFDVSDAIVYEENNC